MTIDTIELWHRRARPQPTDRDFDVQLGCHLEEIAEMFSTLDIRGSRGTTSALPWVLDNLNYLATGLKNGELHAHQRDREAFLDSLCDQIVTAVGVGYCAGMNVPLGLDRVNQSNWSKTVDGEFLRDANGKIKKPDSYVPPDLSGCY